MRLETADGHFVANVMPLEPGPVVVWGLRVFMETGDGSYREVSPTVVIEQR